MYGICNLSIVPIYKVDSDDSQMINQILFGECFEVVEKNKNWSKIKLQFDDFEGFIDNKQYEEISEELFINMSNDEEYFTGELLDMITSENNYLTTIPLGARLPFYKNGQFRINEDIYTYQGQVNTGKLPKSNIIEIAFSFLNVPFLQGGKSPFGIDASGFVQTIYKLCGYHLSKDVEKQAKQGDLLSFIEECEQGDLAFFDDENGKIIHVGIVMNDYKIIHSYGKVRIDNLDQAGIYNADLQKHTHKLRMIRKII